MARRRQPGSAVSQGHRRKASTTASAPDKRVSIEQFWCELCSSFLSLNNRTRHYRECHQQAPGPLPYQCQGCQKRFTRKGSLRRHQRNPKAAASCRRSALATDKLKASQSLEGHTAATSQDSGSIELFMPLGSPVAPSTGGTGSASPEGSFHSYGDPIPSLSPCTSVSSINSLQLPEPFSYATPMCAAEAPTCSGMDSMLLHQPPLPSQYYGAFVAIPQAVLSTPPYPTPPHPTSSGYDLSSSAYHPQRYEPEAPVLFPGPSAPAGASEDPLPYLFGPQDVYPPPDPTDLGLCPPLSDYYTDWLAALSMSPPPPSRQPS